MEKLLKSHWFVKIISFILALMLYTAVAVEQQQASPTPDSLFPGIDDSAGEGEVLRNVEVSAVYDEGEYVLSGLPDTVDVRLQGPSSEIQKFRLQRTPEVFVDLSNYESGTYNVTLQIDGLPDDITAQIEEPTIELTLHNKVTETFPVQIDLLNEDELSRGYIAGIPETDTSEITVTGTEAVIGNIGYVKGYVDLSGAKETINLNVDVKVYNKNYTEISIPVNPELIEVTVPISNPNKEVPVTVEQVGALPDGYELRSIEVEPSSVTVFGPEDILENIDSINNLNIDLAEISEDQTIELDLTAPAGTLYLDPETVEVSIDIERTEEEVNAEEDDTEPNAQDTEARETEPEIEETVTYRDFQISLIGLSEQYEATFVTPENGLFNLIVRGTEAELDALTKSDFEAFVNVSELSTGNHNVEIEVDGPEDVELDQEVRVASITIGESTTRS
jgi:YbbR domain-containing protein